MYGMAKKGLIVGHTDDTPFLLECIAPMMLIPYVFTLGIINSHLRSADNPTYFMVDDDGDVEVFAPYDDNGNPTTTENTMSVPKLISLIREFSKMMSKFYGDNVYILSKSCETHNIFSYSIIGT